MNLNLILPIFVAYDILDRFGENTFCWPSEANDFTRVSEKVVDMRSSGGFSLEIRIHYTLILIPCRLYGNAQIN